MSDKAVDNYAHALEFAPDCYKTQEMKIKPSILMLQYNMFLNSKTQEMCDKGVNTCFIVFQSVLIQIRLKKCVTELFLKILLC